jgi:DNA primase large subunit
VFKNEKWHAHKLKENIWETLLDFNRTTWDRCVQMIRKCLVVEHKQFQCSHQG